MTNDMANGLLTRIGTRSLVITYYSSICCLQAPIFNQESRLEAASLDLETVSSILHLPKVKGQRLPYGGNQYAEYVKYGNVALAVAVVHASDGLIGAASPRA